VFTGTVAVQFVLYNIVLVLALESWYEGSNGVSKKSLVVVEGQKKLHTVGHWFGLVLLYLLQCFDTGDRVTRNIRGLQITLPLDLRVLFQNRWRKETS